MLSPPNPLVIEGDPALVSSLELPGGSVFLVRGAESLSGAPRTPGNGCQRGESVGHMGSRDSFHLHERAKRVCSKDPRLKSLESRFFGTQSNHQAITSQQIHVDKVRIATQPGLFSSREKRKGGLLIVGSQLGFPAASRFRRLGFPMPEPIPRLLDLGQILQRVQKQQAESQEPSRGIDLGPKTWLPFGSGNG